jgi:hypothetical protein
VEGIVLGDGDSHADVALDGPEVRDGAADDVDPDGVRLTGALTSGRPGWRRRSRSDQPRCHF